MGTNLQRHVPQSSEKISLTSGGCYNSGGRGTSSLLTPMVLQRDVQVSTYLEPYSLYYRKGLQLEPTSLLFANCYFFGIVGIGLQTSTSQYTKKHLLNANLDQTAMSQRTKNGHVNQSGLNTGNFQHSEHLFKIKTNIFVVYSCVFTQYFVVHAYNLNSTWVIFQPCVTVRSLASVKIQTLWTSENLMRWMNIMWSFTMIIHVCHNLAVIMDVSTSVRYFY